MSQEENILNNMGNADFDSQFYVISFDVMPYDEITPLSISFGTRNDKDNYINTVADWKYYYLCRSDQVHSENVLNAIKILRVFCSVGDEPDLARENIVFFAVAQALFSETVWKIYNYWQIVVYKEKCLLVESEGKNLNPID